MMKKFFLLIIFAISFMATNPILEATKVKDGEFYTVVKSIPYEDWDSGATYVMEDGSLWLRTWWDGPIYDLAIDQSVVIFPMSENELSSHTWGDRYNIKPYWIILGPDSDSFFGVIYKVKG